MPSDSTPQVALWFWRRYLMDFSAAWYLREYGEGVPVGVQLADGCTLRVEEWPAFAEYLRKEEEAESERRAKPYVPRPKRTVLDPFEGQTVELDVDEPAWLGRDSHG